MSPALRHGGVDAREVGAAGLGQGGGEAPTQAGSAVQCASPSCTMRGRSSDASGREARLEAARDAEADDGPGAPREGGLEQKGEARRIAAARHRHDAGACRDAGFGLEARDGQDGTGALTCPP